MESKSPEGGFDELIRLSQQTSKMEQELARKEQQLAKKEQEAAERRQIVQGLKEINLSVALEQLKTVATPEIIEGVDEGQFVVTQTIDPGSSNNMSQSGGLPGFGGMRGFR